MLQTILKAISLLLPCDVLLPYELQTFRFRLSDLSTINTFHLNSITVPTFLYLFYLYRIFVSFVLRNITKITSCGTFYVLCGTFYVYYKKNA